MNKELIATNVVSSSNDDFLKYAYKWINKSTQKIGIQKLKKEKNDHYYVFNSNTLLFEKKNSVGIGDIIVSYDCGKAQLCEVVNNNYYQEKINIRYLLTDYKYIIEHDDENDIVDFKATISNNIQMLIDGCYIFGFNPDQCKDSLKQSLIGEAFYNATIQLNIFDECGYRQVPSFRFVLDIVKKKVSRLLSQGYPCDKGIIDTLFS